MESVHQSKHYRPPVSSHIERYPYLEGEDEVKKRIGELAMVMTNLFIENKESSLIVSGQFNYVHYLEEGEYLHPDGPDIKFFPVEPEDRYVEDLKVMRAYLLKADNPMSPLVFVNEGALIMYFQLVT